MIDSKTVLIFGAGATAALKMPTTENQNVFFKTFFFEDDFTELKDELKFTDMEIQEISDLKKQTVKNEYNVCELIIFVKVFFRKDSFEIMDLYNLIDKQIKSNQNLLRHEDHEIKTLYPHDLVQYRKAMLVVLQCVLSIQTKKAQENPMLNRYVAFFETMGADLLRTKGDLIKETYDLRAESFVVSNFSYISFNWDVLILWSMFIAHQNLNNQNKYYHADNHGVFKLKIFNDFATFMVAKRLDESLGNNKKWYPYNESVAFRINDPEHPSDRRIVLIPTFFPHGQSNWLECPCCGKLSMYLGNSFKLKSQTLTMNTPYKMDGKYTCIHCSQKLTTKDSSMLLQTLYKVNAPYIEEIQREMKLKIREAKRLVIIGFSLPSDDLEYKAVFTTMKANEPKEIFLVLKHGRNDNTWVAANDVIKNLENDKYTKEIKDSIQRYCNIFGEENVKVNLAGFPDAMDSIYELFGIRPQSIKEWVPFNGKYAMLK